MDLDDLPRLRRRIEALEAKAATPAGIPVSADLSGALERLGVQVDELRALEGRIADLETRIQGVPASPRPDTPPPA